MPDREKVIKGLEHCISADKTCSGCPYEGTTCTTTLNADALALLKEQEPVKPKIDAFGHPYCPKCKILVYEMWEFCPHCGKALKLNEHTR